MTDTLTLQSPKSLGSLIVEAARSDPGDYRAQYETTAEIWKREQAAGRAPEPPEDQLHFDNDAAVRAGVLIFNQVRQVLGDPDLRWEKKTDNLNSALGFLEGLVAVRDQVQAEYRRQLQFHRETTPDAPVRENVCRRMEAANLPHDARYPSELDQLHRSSRESVLKALDRMDEEREAEGETYFYEDELEAIPLPEEIDRWIELELSFMAALRRAAELMAE